ncbi:MAG: SURF1 family protein, partial [Alphaproteobacteria bacterium]|nr:SURF1 family protein [Alphaproteobacteria bacterium]
TLCALAGFAILCALGTWQLQRLEWKTQRIAALEEAYSRKSNRTFRATDYNDDKLLPRGRVIGRFVASQSIVVGLGENAALYQLVRLKDGGYIVANLGQTSPRITLKKDWLRGTLHPYPSAHMFMPRNNVEKRQFFFPQQKDFADLFRAKNLKPVILYPDALHRKPELKNNHLAYSIFWFCMAAVLGVVFILRFMLRTKTNESNAIEVQE